MKMENLLILGAGGHGQVVRELAMSLGQFEKIEFLDDNSEKAIGKCEDYLKFRNEFSCAHAAFGNNVFRMQWFEKLRQAGFHLPVLIHETAWVSPSATIKEGTVVLPKAVVNTNAVVEENCIVNCAAVVDHDVKLEEGVHIGPGAVIKAPCVIEMCRKVEAGEVVFP